MRHFIFLATMLVVGTVIHAQILKPVKWSYVAKKVNETEAIVFLRATIDRCSV